MKSYATVILIILLVLSSFYDLKFNKIPNKVTFPIIILGIVYRTTEYGLTGTIQSFIGIFVGFLIFIIPFALGGMGAGDVKLMMAIGGIKGAWFVLLTFFYAAIVGGVIGLIYTIKKKGLRSSFISFSAYVLTPIFKFLYHITRIKLFLNIYAYFIKTEKSNEKLFLPYAVPISIGAVIALYGIVPSIFVR